MRNWAQELSTTNKSFCCTSNQCDVISISTHFERWPSSTTKTKRYEDIFVCILLTWLMFTLTDTVNKVIYRVDLRRLNSIGYKCLAIFPKQFQPIDAFNWNGICGKPNDYWFPFFSFSSLFIFFIEFLTHFLLFLYGFFFISFRI